MKGTRIGIDIAKTAFEIYLFENWRLFLILMPPPLFNDGGAYNV